MMKKGLPPARSAISTASASSMRRPEACRARSIDSSAESGSSWSRTAFAVVVPHAGRCSSSVVRASARTRTLRWPAAGGRAEAFDQLEHRRAELVRVLEHEDGGRVAREAVDERDEPGLHVLHERRLRLPIGHAEQEREPFDEVLGVAGVRRSVRRARAGGASPSRPGRPPPGRRARRRSSRPGENVAVSVNGAGAADEHGDVVLDDRDELVGQARLADAGFAEDADEHRVSGAGRAVEALAQDRELARAPDERDRPARRTRREALRRGSRRWCPRRSPSRWPVVRSP